GVGAAVVFAGGFGESSNDGRQLEAELAAAARQSGIALLGPNSMGVVNAAVPMGLWVGAEYIPPGLSGAVLVGQSGGMIDAVRTLGKPTGPQLFIDTGNEAILTTADFVDFLIDDPAVSAIGLIVEAVADVDRMAAALRKAQNRQKPVVGLQVGRSERGSAAIFGHTGALVSDADALRAFLARHGVLDVRDIDELTETLSLLVSGIETEGRGVVLVGTSGGKTAHFADLCEESGLELAEISPQTCRELAEIFDTDYTGANPIDMGLGPEGVEADKTRRVLETLVADETVGLVGVCGDLPVDPDRFVGAANYVDRAMRAAEAVADAGTSVVFIDTRPARSASQGRSWRVPVLEGSATSVKAIRHLLDFEKAGRAQAVVGPTPAVAAAEAGGDGPLAGLDLELLRQQTWDGGADGVRLMKSDAVSDLLRRYGVDEVPGATVQLSHTAPGGDGLGPAVAAATEVGYPLAAKLHCPVHVHKSRAGLLKLDIRSTPDLLSAADQMRRAHSSICSDPHPQVLHLQSMVDVGLEVIAGVKVDPQFGPVLAVGIGGVAVEALQQVSRALLPLTAGQVAALVESSPVGRVLATMPQADHEALHRNLLAVSALAWDLRSVLAEADFNPITVLADGRGAWCVDVRVFIAAPGGAQCP
ncbi:MAG: acetate--CoA ligase family protein, partial [Acidimicrobiaceae bacterium]|nr:acetate--CoA ligase family protein [Acidimicrobiaceae bacterium]